MKLKTISLIAFAMLAICLRAKSQVNDYLNNDPVWKINSTCGIPAPCIKYDDYNYFTLGDTLINSLVYKQINKQGAGNTQWLGPPPASPNCIQGSFSYTSLATGYYIRSSGKQMYLRQNNDPMEYLLYDFDLTIGDTLPLTFNNFSTDITVTGIDSFSTPYGYRKIFTLAGSTWSQFLIEGVGHSSGFLEPVNIGFDCGFNLFCYALNDTSYYPSSGLNCDVFSSINEIEVPLQYLIYPNPFINSSLIEIENLKAPTLVSITNSLGKVIKTDYTDDKGRLTIHSNGMAAGVYYISITQGGQILKHQKLLLLKE